MNRYDDNQSVFRSIRCDVGSEFQSLSVMPVAAVDSDASLLDLRRRYRNLDNLDTRISLEVKRAVSASPDADGKGEKGKMTPILKTASDSKSSTRGFTLKDETPVEDKSTSSTFHTAEPTFVSDTSPQSAKLQRQKHFQHVHEQVQNRTASRPSSQSFRSRTRKHKQHKNSPQQLPSITDFYRNSTVLSRLILFKKHKQALDRLRRFPAEAAVWVCAKRAANDADFVIRQLPIHIACLNLQRSTDTTIINELINNLTVAFPASCKAADHFGRYPLHIALCFDAAPETISMFLMAWPESVNLKTLRTGRTLTELNQNRTGSTADRIAEVQRILDIEQGFWEAARNEACQRLLQKQVSWPVLSMINDEVIGLTSTLRPISSSYLNEEFGVANDEHTTNEIAFVTWEKLEERATSLENILTEVYVTNYYLQNQIQQLAESSKSLVEKVEISKEITKQLNHVKAENERLRAEIHFLRKEQLQVEKAQKHQSLIATRQYAALALSPRGKLPKSLKQHLQQHQTRLGRSVSSGLSLTLSVDSAAPLNALCSSRAGHHTSTPSSNSYYDEKQVFQENKILKKKYKELTLLYHEQKRQLQGLKNLVQTLMENEAKKLQVENSCEVPSQKPPTVTTSECTMSTIGIGAPEDFLYKTSSKQSSPSRNCSQSGMDTLDCLNKHCKSGRLQNQINESLKQSGVEHSVRNEWAPEQVTEMSDNFNFIFRTGQIEELGKDRQDIVVPALLTNADWSFEPIQTVGMRRTGFSSLFPELISLST